MAQVVTIEHEVGTSVFTLCDNKVVTGVVDRVTFESVRKNKGEAFYNKNITNVMLYYLVVNNVTGFVTRQDNMVFATKEALLASL